VVQRVVPGIVERVGMHVVDRTEGHVQSLWEEIARGARRLRDPSGMAGRTSGGGAGAAGRRAAGPGPGPPTGGPRCAAQRAGTSARVRSTPHGYSDHVSEIPKTAVEQTVEIESLVSEALEMLDQIRYSL